MADRIQDRHEPFDFSDRAGDDPDLLLEISLGSIRATHDSAIDWARGEVIGELRGILDRLRQRIANPEQILAYNLLEEQLDAMFPPGTLDCWKARAEGLADGRKEVLDRIRPANLAALIATASVCYASDLEGISFEEAMRLGWTRHGRDETGEGYTIPTEAGIDAVRELAGMLAEGEVSK